MEKKVLEFSQSFFLMIPNFFAKNKYCNTVKISKKKDLQIVYCVFFIPQKYSMVIGQYPKYLYLIGSFLRNKKYAVNEKTEAVVKTNSDERFSNKWYRTGQNTTFLRLSTVILYSQTKNQQSFFAY
jgi:hypothetical protein